jgi:hypothetical protein
MNHKKWRASGALFHAGFERSMDREQKIHAANSLLMNFSALYYSRNKFLHIQSGRCSSGKKRVR